MNLPISSTPYTNAWKLALAAHAQTNPFAAAALAPLLGSLFSQDALLKGGFGMPGFGASPFGVPSSPTGCMPAPSIQASGAPAGKGLEKNPAGWPEGAVKTAGGYTIVPEGKDNAWSVYGPDQKPGDKPMTRVWGDPHVNEKDGTSWDFTKSSNFRLPDGTNINVKTTSENGQSVTSALDITNGADHVNIGGIDKNRPSTGPVLPDGYEQRARLQNTGETYHLGGSGGDDVKWFKEKDGVMQGEVTGSHYDAGTNRYEQHTNAASQYYVDPSLRPPVGSEAWGNQLRMEAVDIARRSGNPFFAEGMASLMHSDHAYGAMCTQLGFDPFAAFGGYGALGGYGAQAFSVAGMFGVLQAQEAMNQAGFALRASLLAC